MFESYSNHLGMRAVWGLLLLFPRSDLPSQKSFLGYWVGEGGEGIIMFMSKAGSCMPHKHMSRSASTWSTGNPVHVNWCEINTGKCTGTCRHRHRHKWKDKNKQPWIYLAFHWKLLSFHSSGQHLQSRESQIRPDSAGQISLSLYASRAVRMLRMSSGYWQQPATL